MPKERSIAKRLSGGEALNSLCHQIRSKLASLPAFQRHNEDLDALMRGVWARLCRHEHFHSHKGYHGYSASVRIVIREKEASVSLTFRPAMSYAPPLSDLFTVPAEVSDAELTLEVPVRPPNAVRTEAEMPLPVQVEEAGQIVEKMVPAAKYKGKVKPGAKPQTATLDTPAIRGRLEMPEGAMEQYGVQTRG